MKKVLLFGAMLALATACNRDNDDVHHEDHAHWDYENPDWASQGYSECAGMVQSPIDIVTTGTVKTTLPAIDFNYATFQTKSVDNGHTVQVNTDNKSTITYNGDEYTLAQFHYHGKSEHTVDGVYKPMEVHFVHKSAKTGAIVVLGVFVKGGGADHAQYAKYLDAFPTNKNVEITKESNIDPAAMLPTNKGYYNYTGSLTTPPCSQGLSWIVFKEDVTISDTQLAAFQKAYGHNNRPVQKLGSRTVYETN